MPDDEDKFSPEDEASFSAMTEDDIKQVERFRKWQDRKKSGAAPQSQNPPPSPQSSLGDMKSLTIGQLEELTKAGPATRSILRNLLDVADLSDKNAPVAPAPKTGGLIPRKGLRLL
jgi:hypothetical protein